MGLQRKTGAEIQTQVWQPCKERILRLRPESGPHGLRVLLFAMQLRKQERL